MVEFPDAWSIAIIHPIFKSDPANYRGITVGPVLEKLFAIVVDSRLRSWAETNNLRAEARQASRNDRRTTDYRVT